MRWPAGSEVTVLSVAKPAIVAHTLVDAGGIGYMKAYEEEQVQEHHELVARVEREFQDVGFKTAARVHAPCSVMVVKFGAKK